MAYTVSGGAWIVQGRTAATRYRGLSRFRAEHKAAGHRVLTWYQHELRGPAAVEFEAAS